MCLSQEPGVGEHNVEPILLALDPIEEAIKICKIRHISLNCGYVVPNFLHGRGQLLFPPPGNKYICAFAYEPLCRSKTDSAVAAGNQCNPSFKVPHMSLPTFLNSLRGRRVAVVSTNI